MRLYMACTGQQSLDFHYRVPENNRMLKMTVPSGQNRQIGDDSMNAPQIEGIIAQGRIYGMVPYEDVDDVKRKIQIVAIFRRDEPVPAGMIAEVIAYNRKELTTEGKERREELAVVASNLIGQGNERAGNTMQMSIEEERPGTMNVESGQRLAEGYAAPESDVARVLGSDAPIGTKRGRKR